MPNKTKDWLDDALDAVPTQPVSFGFRSELRDRLVAEGLREAPEAAPAGRLHRMLRPLMTAAAAVLLVAVGAIAVAGLGTVQGNFGSYRAITERTTAASQLQSALLSAGIAIKDFMLTSSPASQQRANADIQAACAA